MNGVAKGIKNGGNLLIDTFKMMPNIRHGNADVFGKGSWTIHPDAYGIFAEVSASGQAIPATTANDMPLGAHDLARIKVTHIFPYGNDLTHKLMPYNHRDWNRLLGPGIPLVNMQIRSANTCLSNANQYIVNANLGFGNILEPKTSFRV